MRLSKDFPLVLRGADAGCPFCGGGMDTAIDGKVYCKRCLICPFFTRDEWNNRPEHLRLLALEKELSILRKAAKRYEWLTFDVSHWLQVKWYKWLLRRQLSRAEKGREKYIDSIRMAYWAAKGYMDLKDAGPRLLYWCGSLELEDAVYQADLLAQGKKAGSMLFTVEIK